ncbi:glutamyl-Q tRNA(Asp) synthetase [Rhodopseudomonas julia]|uniref:Glutamyl-Q tRNA(Asp) synthetase n=1 Tax=Rhodopseudomonas julia TaxID=200617 RepID=A0ABU0C501_9BRAD|nr:tRNA glutamyl-Q(34) synthetase GluQRS [Rhodopseudomonas julia]MDQ0325588.1 glutamyl-Q tRNA(Asp) synthetase [Rhodopseudomonas julia]
MNRAPEKPVFRFAPSPNGYLHLGHAYSALLNERAAGAADGRLLLRMEDIDYTRARLEFTQAIFDDLSWLGIAFEQPVLCQSHRFPAYAGALAALDRLGLLYPAFLSRSEIRGAISEKEKTGHTWPRDPDGAPHYPGLERDWSSQMRADRIATGAPYALRLDMRRALAGLEPLAWQELDLETGETTRVSAHPSTWGDVILARKDVPASYHLAVTLDDAYQGVTHVVRGADLEAATSVHRLLQVLLGLPAPLYHHHRLILDKEGRKLAKSAGSTALGDLREAGATPDEIRLSLGFAPPAAASVA